MLTSKEQSSVTPSIPHKLEEHATHSPSNKLAQALSSPHQEFSDLANPLLIGLSGPSSSGKTTLARQLKRILPNTSILYQDDFYLEDSQIPCEVETHQVQDWDCVEALDISALRDALSHLKEHGNIPQLKSIQNQNTVGSGGEIESAIIDELRKHVLETVPSMKERRIVIVDGFLLFANNTKHLMSMFDIKLFLRTSFSDAKTRRESRTGYVTLEGFWEDPPFYVDDIVWPNYVKEHAFLFKNGDVEGDFDEDVCKSIGIKGMPKNCSNDVVRLVRWAVKSITEYIEDPKNGTGNPSSGPDS
ncbi:P-loop containing nucleoside triphosphate hydrolase protein [Viridothelium virens]|uniref:P-loop containing nucleoside triphosphate hydrolase protein n=1 Tax=Viridothelium virens TaxID=1048519 RepID=A0A6A6HFP9_VIRVR|nr:P-loop containing nucleoside triphosphate hydrolase protein [Viridothelium virens]